MSTSTSNSKSNSTSSDIVSKVCFIGNKKTNKSTIVRELCPNPNSTIVENNYNGSTLGVSVHVYYSETHIYNIFDCGGRYQGLGDDYYNSCNIFVIFTRDMKDDDDLSFEEWKAKALNICPKAAIHHVHNAKVEDLLTILV